MLVLIASPIAWKPLSAYSRLYQHHHVASPSSLAELQMFAPPVQSQAVPDVLGNGRVPPGLPDLLRRSDIPGAASSCSTRRNRSGFLTLSLQDDV